MVDVRDDKMPNDTELRTESIKLALEWSKQIIALATGTLVISGTFMKDILKGPIIWKDGVVWCWIGMIISVFFGIIFLGNLCSLLSSGVTEQRGIYAPQSLIIALIHILSFFVGLVLFVIFVAKNI